MQAMQLKVLLKTDAGVSMVRARPNHSLNRTHCGMRLKPRHFILGL